MKLIKTEKRIADNILYGLFPEENFSRGENLLQQLAPELVKVLDAMPKTGTAAIKVTLINERLFEIVYKYLNFKTNN